MRHPPAAGLLAKYTQGGARIATTDYRRAFVLYQLLAKVAHRGLQVRLRQIMVPRDSQLDKKNY